MRCELFKFHTKRRVGLTVSDVRSSVRKHDPGNFSRTRCRRLSRQTDIDRRVSVEPARPTREKIANRYEVSQGREEGRQGRAPQQPRERPKDGRECLEEGRQEGREQDAAERRSLGSRCDARRTKIGYQHGSESRPR